jgi:hypothetical protein
VEIARVRAGDHDDRDIASLGPGAESTLDIASAETRQHEIKYHDVGRVSVDIPQRLDAVFDRDDGISGGDERNSIQFAKSTIILDDEDVFLPWRREHERIVKEFLPCQKLSIMASSAPHGIHVASEAAAGENGWVGHRIAAAFGTDPKSSLDADLLRMKTLIETGHAPHDAAARFAGAET